jgi:hypothetical protein
MFLNYIKNALAKKIVKKSLANFKLIYVDSKIETIGVVIDAVYSERIESLMSDLVDQGIKKEHIQILVFRNNPKEEISYPSFSLKDMNWSATFKNDSVDEFVNQHFDLLINYYDVEKAPLLLVSFLSKANFKTGFASIDKRVNHFIVNTLESNKGLFLSELLKYLKILKKI